MKMRNRPSDFPGLAKLTRPRLRDPVPRERLFTALDDARATRRIISVVAPPGSGKTTMIASWLDSREITGPWVQVDVGDSDLATFFYYLGQAASPLGRKKGSEPMPLLAREYLADLHGFARRFFRQFFSRLPVGAVTVLDNYQEIPEGDAFHALVALAIEELPLQQLLVIISRRELPECFARTIVNGDVAFFRWEDLRFTLDEARTLAATRAQINESAVQALLTRSEGWGAGLTLLIESSKQPGGSLVSLADREALFDYFATQIFQALPRDTQTFLMASAQVEQIPLSVARALAPTSDVSSMLEDLRRRNLFTQRRDADEPVYWYHALFREFLLVRSQRLCTDVQRLEWQVLLAGLLSGRSEHAQAVHLLQRAGQWAACESLIAASAEFLLTQGRDQSVRNWIAALPADRVTGNPWMRFWLGVALLSVDQTSARLQLEAAYELFLARSDPIGQLRSISVIINSYFYEWTHWRPLDRWILRSESLMKSRPEFPSRECEHDVMCSLLIATLYRRPDHPLLRTAVDRLRAMDSPDLGMNRRLAGATFLLTYFNLTNQPDKGHDIIQSTTSWIDDPTITPLMRVWWANRLTTWMCISGEFNQVQSRVDEVRHLCATHGMEGLAGASIAISTHEHWAALGLRNLRRTAELTALMSQSARSDRPSEYWQAAQARLRYTLCGGDITSALMEGPSCVTGAEKSGMIYLEMNARYCYANALAEAGRCPEAIEQIDRCRDLVRNTCLDYYEPELDLMAAFVARESGDPSNCHRLLRASFQRASQVGSLWRDARLSRRVLAAMCAEAMEACIEADYACTLIKRFDLDPPPTHPAHWPWPVIVRTLGTFEVLVRSVPLTFPGKAPKKPLAVLKAIISHGPSPVPLQRLADDLWPGADGDAALHALAMALQRLRALLIIPDAVLIESEQVRLNSNKCWVDVVALEQETNPPAYHALRQYRGRFLPGEADALWTVAKRERLHTLFLTQAVAFGERLEMAKDWDQALRHYLACIVADELVERFYQGALRCHLALRQPAEGLALLRRWRHLCSIVLGVKPATATETLSHRLREDAGQQESISHR